MKRKLFLDADKLDNCDPAIARKIIGDAFDRAVAPLVAGAAPRLQAAGWPEDAIEGALEWQAEAMAAQRAEVIETIMAGAAAPGRLQ